MAAKRKTSKKIQETDWGLVSQEFLALGHLVKYSLYLLNKSIIVNALISAGVPGDKAVEEANRLIIDLDLDTKERMRKQKVEELQ